MCLDKICGIVLLVSRLTYSLQMNVSDQLNWKRYSDGVHLHLLDHGKILRNEELEKDFHHITVNITLSGIIVQKENIQIFNSAKYFMGDQRRHGTLYLFVFHPEQGHLLLLRHFRVSEPGESKSAFECLSHLEPSKLVLLIVKPPSPFLRDKNLMKLLSGLGSNVIENLAYTEFWAMITHTPPKLDGDVKIWYEASTATKSVMTNGLLISAKIPRGKDFSCEWHFSKSRQKQFSFCQKYAGYQELCGCKAINPGLFRYHASSIEMVEEIPVAMLTAVKPFHFYRQLLNLLRTPGAAQTKIFVYIDGPNQEIIELAELFQLPIRVHRSQGERGSNTKLNMHFKFSVQKIFQEKFNFQKAIILEDDLLLSPDFLRFFHQTAWLLDADPSIYVINAFHLNSIPSVASDPSTLLRLDGYPQFGWLITKTTAESILPNWVEEKAVEVDWDWSLGLEIALQGRHVIVPEISRTFHAGAAGSHVTGWEQAYYYDTMIYNTDPNVTLKKVHRVQEEIYDSHIRRELNDAEILDFNPCMEDPTIPLNRDKFKMYLHTDTKLHKNQAFETLTKCLHAHSRDGRGSYKRMARYNFKGKIIYIVGCPVSPFCPQNGSVPLSVLSEDIMDMAWKMDFDWRSRNSNVKLLIREKAKTADEEFSQANTREVNVTVN